MFNSPSRRWRVVIHPYSELGSLDILRGMTMLILTIKELQRGSCDVVSVIGDAGDSQRMLERMWEEAKQNVKVTHMMKHRNVLLGTGTVCQTLSSLCKQIVAETMVYDLRRRYSFTHNTHGLVWQGKVVAISILKTLSMKHVVFLFFYMSFNSPET